MSWLRSLRETEHARQCPAGFHNRCKKSNLYYDRVQQRVVILSRVGAMNLRHKLQVLLIAVLVLVSGAGTGDSWIVWVRVLIQHASQTLHLL